MDLRPDDQEVGWRLLPGSGRPTVATSHQAPTAKQVLVANGLVPGLLQFATADLPAGAVVEPHRHASMTEVFHLLAGRLQARCGGQDLDLTAGDCLVVNAGTEHAFVALTDTRLIYFGLENSGL